MTNPQHMNRTWAQENGCEFHVETEGVMSEGARNLDIFRKAEGFRDHVRGIHRDRLFEILDVQYEVLRGGESGAVWKTIVLIPTDGLDLPNFKVHPGFVWVC